MKMVHLLKRSGVNGFFLGLLLMVGGAWLFPSLGTSNSPLHLHEITKYGVALIFFFYGLRLSPAELRSGLSNWKLHIIIQCTTFVLFPLTVISFSFLLDQPDYRLLWIGTFYLSALPSTVSSSVVMVSIAGGNVPAAIFNASISSILGILLTPLWMSPFLGEVSDVSGLLEIVVRLCIQILLPVTVGLLLHSRWGSFANRFRTQMRLFDQLIILLIVYTAFSESFAGSMFSQLQGRVVFILALVMMAFFLFMLALMAMVSRLTKLGRADTITVLFCGSKKSLVQGAVMGRVLFPDSGTFGILLLPIMLYHALQLIAGSILAERIAHRAKP